jgi:hypothetical protein
MKDLGALIASMTLIGCAVFNHTEPNETVFVPGVSYTLKAAQKGKYEIQEMDSLRGIITYHKNNNAVYAKAYYGTDPKTKDKVISSVHLDWNSDGKTDLLMIAGLDYKLMLVK